MTWLAPTLAFLLHWLTGIAVCNTFVPECGAIAIFLDHMLYMWMSMQPLARIPNGICMFIPFRTSNGASMMHR